MVFILSALWWRRIRGLWKLPDGRDWLWLKLGLVLMGRTMFSKSLIQFSVDWWGCVPSFFDLIPNYGKGNEDNGQLLQKYLYWHCCIQGPRPCSRPLSKHASAVDSWTLRKVFVSLLLYSIDSFILYWSHFLVLSNKRMPFHQYLEMDM